MTPTAWCCFQPNGRVIAYLDKDEAGVRRLADVYGFETVPLYRIPADKMVVDRDEWRELRVFARVSGYPEAHIDADLPFGGDNGEWGMDLSKRHGITSKEAEEFLYEPQAKEGGEG